MGGISESTRASESSQETGRKPTGKEERRSTSRIPSTGRIGTTTEEYNRDSEEERSFG
jgi:hypothetical protein